MDKWHDMNDWNESSSSRANRKTPPKHANPNSFKFWISYTTRKMEATSKHIKGDDSAAALSLSLSLSSSPSLVSFVSSMFN
jgi:hypothetical protein